MNRSNEIIVGVDGSAESNFAIAWAVAEARARGCGLVVVHACEARNYGLWATTKGLRAGLREMARPVVDDALAFARRIDPRVPARGGVLVASPARALVRLSSLVALAVVGRNGRDAVSRMLLGSVTEHLAANAGCPVVAVGRPPLGVDVGTVERVVAAVATPSANEQTLRFAFAEAAHRDAPLAVLHAGRQGDSAQADLALAIAGLRGEYPAVDVRTDLEPGPLADAVASMCAPDDLLVMGHRRRLPFGRHTLGGRAGAVLHAASCPVAVVDEPVEETVPVAALASAEGAIAT